MYVRTITIMLCLIEQPYELWQWLQEHLRIKMKMIEKNKKKYKIFFLVLNNVYRSISLGYWIYDFM